MNSLKVSPRSVFMAVDGRIFEDAREDDGNEVCVCGRGTRSKRGFLARRVTIMGVGWGVLPSAKLQH